MPQAPFKPNTVAAAWTPQTARDIDDNFDTIFRFLRTLVPNVDGIDGRDGVTIPGQDGEDGADGPPGLRGLDGAVGLSGGMGPPGIAGSDGDDGYAWPSWSGASPTPDATLAIRKTADETVTDAAVQPDNQLVANLEGNASYWFLFTLFLTNGGAAEGFQVELNGTAGVSALKAEVSTYDETLNALAAFARVAAFGVTVGSGISAGDNFSQVEGVIRTSTAGTLLIRWAQNVVGVGAGVTVQINSSLTLRRMGD